MSFCAIDSHLFGESTMANCTARHRAALQLPGMEWRPEALHEGSREAGIGQRGDAAIAFQVHGAPVSRFGVAPSFAVAFRIVTSRPVP